MKVLGRTAYLLSRRLFFLYCVDRHSLVSRVRCAVLCRSGRVGSHYTLVCPSACGCVAAGSVGAVLVTRLVAALPFPLALPASGVPHARRAGAWS